MTNHDWFETAPHNSSTVVNSNVQDGHCLTLWHRMRESIYYGV